ncbi:SHOCT domain-containing protein [Erythrobacter fulvus]|uniref:SHOCT domain-containing protein n=1 Tax=Erythrobacter fulvus TaxID=2987523 RepID=UPI002358E1F0|nr:SHOCT domain-containing protein [Erythrobacter fulvus]
MTLALATSSLFFAAPALAMPDDPAELNSLIRTKYNGDAAAYVEDNRGEFRKMGCEGRADLLQALLDAGLAFENLEQSRYSAHAQAIRCAFDKGKMEALALLLTPDAMTMFEEVEFGQTWQASLLSSAIYWDSYDRVRHLLENGVHAAQHDKEAAILTREEHLLLAAYEALDTEKEDAIRAFQDAGFGHIIDAARNKANWRYVIDRMKGSRGGGGGGLFRSLLGGVAGAALGGTTGAALGFLGAGADASGDGDGNGAPQGSGPLPLATNRADLGAQLNPVTAPRRGLQVQKVDAGGPSALAGLMQGDVIVSIAGIPVASRGSFYVATEEAFSKERFEVEYLRDGVQQTALFDKSKAAPETGAAQAAGNLAPEAQAPARAPDPASTLDELQKLGDLRDRGILSEEEFEAMKARILGADTKASEGAANHSDGTPIAEAFGIRRGQSITDLSVIEEQPNDMICPLLSGPISILELVTKEEWNGKEAQAGRDHRQAA